MTKKHIDKQRVKEILKPGGLFDQLFDNMMPRRIREAQIETLFPSNSDRSKSTSKSLPVPNKYDNGIVVSNKTIKNRRSK